MTTPDQEAARAEVNRLIMKNQIHFALLMTCRANSCSMLMRCEFHGDREMCARELEGTDRNILALQAVLASFN